MITLYSTHCPRCKVLEKKLEQKGIEYQIVDDIDRIMELNILSVPMLRVGTNLMNFTDAVNWVNNQ